MQFEEIVEKVRKGIGRTGRAQTKQVEKGAVLKFCAAIGETNPIYTDEDYARTTPYGGLIAPPTYLSVFTPGAFQDVIDKDIPLKKFLHTDDIVETFAPIRVGDYITFQAALADVFVKEGKLGRMLFQAADMTLTNQAADRVAVVRVLTVFY